MPPASFRPETWFHFIGGNVSTQGITADLEAIAGAGISGVQLFHGQFGGKWPGTGEPITCLSEKWDDAVKHAVWCEPYTVDISEALQQGENQLTIEVTSTWHNRLVHDAGLPEDERKTWTIEGPKKEAGLSRSGLLGPVVIRTGEGRFLSKPLDIGSGRNIRTGKNDFVPDASPEDQP